MKYTILKAIVLIAVLSGHLVAQRQPLASGTLWIKDLDQFDGCSMEGTAKSDAGQALNRLKNRWRGPASKDFNPAITLQALLAPGYDHGRWGDSQAASIVGYVVDVKPGSVETCNCRARDLAHRDIHLELSLDPMAGTAQRFVVEITPRWRAIMAQQGIDWNLQAVRDHFLGRWVRIQGWMLWDKEHVDETENTAPGRSGNWRASAWEIHPVTSIDVVSRPR